MTSVVEDVLRISGELHPDMYARTVAIAKIIAPEAYLEDWIINPPESSLLFKYKLMLMRASAESKAQTILTYLGVNTQVDWYEILDRLAKEGLNGNTNI
jgi:hypothetical protein